MDVGDASSALLAAWQATSTLEIVSVAFGLAYVILAARENVFCWPAAIVNTVTAIILFWDASLLMESALNVFYFLIAFYGWWQWKNGGESKNQKPSALPITSWAMKNHGLAISSIILLTIISGKLLSENTNAALPYLDSFTTWAAVICTWMVTQKIIENWLYWIVIDSAGVYLFFEKGLLLYSLLFVLYTIIAVYGYFHWRTALRSQNNITSRQTQQQS